MDNAGFKIRIAVIGILLLVLVMPAYADEISDNIPVTMIMNMDNVPATAISNTDNSPGSSEIVWFPVEEEYNKSFKAESNPDPEKLVSEMIEATNSTEYLKLQWDISNFTITDQNEYTFWITNRKSPDILLPDVKLINHDTNENIGFNFTKKTKTDGSETANIWNLFGLLNPDSKLSKDETCQVTYNADIINLSVTYGDVIKTRWGIKV